MYLPENFLNLKYLNNLKKYFSNKNIIKIMPVERKYANNADIYFISRYSKDWIIWWDMKYKQRKLLTFDKP